MDHSILRFAKRFFAGTLLSRLSGLVRDMAMAFCFGSAPEIAAFMVAYRLANLFRRLLGEGTLTSSFVPHFESLSEEKEQAAFYRDTAFSLLILLLGAVGIMELVLAIMGSWLENGWREIAYLAMWMAPGLIFICLFALNSAFLQCQKSYFLPAAAPVLFNIAWVGAAGSVCRFPIEEAMQWLSISIVLAFAAQWLLTAISVRKRIALHLPWSQWFRPRLFSSEWKKLIRPFALGIIGIGAMQINSALDAIFARIADPSGPAYLWYAIRIQQLPLALFGIALSGALLPPLSRAMKEGALERYCELLQTALRHSASLIVPSTFALFVLGASGLNLLYGRGDFSPSDVRETLFCAWGYGLGLLPAILVLLFATGFYAQKSYDIPLWASLSSVAANAIFNAIAVFVLHWGAMSIALATSLAACLNGSILAWGLHRRIGSLFPPAFCRFLIRLFLSSLMAALFTAWVGYLWFGRTIWNAVFSRAFSEQFLQFGILAFLFFASFLILAYFFKMKEWFELFRRPSSISLD